MNEFDRDDNTDDHVARTLRDAVPTDMGALSAATIRAQVSRNAKRRRSGWAAAGAVAAVVAVATAVPGLSGPSGVSPSDRRLATAGPSTTNPTTIQVSTEALASFTVERVSEPAGLSRLVLVTQGSSSCPWQILEARASSNPPLTIEVFSQVRANGVPCTADNRSRRETVSLPDGLEADQVDEVVLTTNDGASRVVAVQPGKQPGGPDGSCNDQSEPSSSDEVLAYFDCAVSVDPPELHAVSYPVDPAADVAFRLRTALVAYLSGPPDDGIASPPLATGELLNSATVEGDRAIIDLDLTGVGVSTSYQSILLWETLKATAFQFPSIQVMEPRFNGSCEDFGEAVQAGECLVAHRNGPLVRDGAQPSEQAPDARTVDVPVFYIDAGSSRLVREMRAVPAVGDRREEALRLAADRPRTGLLGAIPTGAFDEVSFDGIDVDGEFAVGLTDRSFTRPQEGMTNAEAVLGIRAVVCTVQNGTEAPVVFYLNRKPVDRLFGQPLQGGAFTDADCPDQ